MFALRKLRARRAPGNQAHVTNLKESPALLAADAAEAALRGFAELETTVAVARYAPLNAISILVGTLIQVLLPPGAVDGAGRVEQRPVRTGIKMKRVTLSPELDQGAFTKEQVMRIMEVAETSLAACFDLQTIAADGREAES